MRAAKRDAIERKIIDHLTSCGAHVQQAWPPMPFDLLVGHRGQWTCVEVKSGDFERLTASEAAFERSCVRHGLPHRVVRSVDDALRIVGARVSA